MTNVVHIVARAELHGRMMQAEGAVGPGQQRASGKRAGVLGEGNAGGVFVALRHRGFELCAVPVYLG